MLTLQSAFAEIMKNVRTEILRYTAKHEFSSRYDQYNECVASNFLYAMGINCSSTGFPSVVAGTFLVIECAKDDKSNALNGLIRNLVENANRFNSWRVANGHGEATWKSDAVDVWALNTFTEYLNGK
jgi:hypothetical protein